MTLYTEEEIRVNERLSIRNGNFATVGISIVSNFSALYVLSALHANSQEVALLNALPALMAIIATWIGAVWMSSLASKKNFCVRASVVARAFYFILAFIPFVIHGAILTLVVVLLIALMNFPQSFATLSWQSLIGDLIPEQRRARFFGLRNRLTTIVGMLSTLIPGIILQLFPVTSIPPYQAFFTIAFLASIFEIYYLILHTERQANRPKRRLAFVLTPGMFLAFFRKSVYRKFLIGALLFNLGWQMAWPLFNIYQIKDAGATAIWVSLFTVANQLSQILTFTLWGKISTRLGNSITFGIACFGMAVSPVLTVLSTNLVYLVVLNLLTGMFVGGVTMLQFNHLLQVTSKAQRTAYIAHFNILLGLVGFIAPEIGVLFLSFFHMDGAMGIASVVRAAGGFFFIFVVANVGRKAKAALT